MARQRKIHDAEHMGVKEVFGVTSLSMISSITAIFMSSLFMQYMTDYAGLGAWGATLATTLLLVARIIDAVDDPIQGFIMDNAKIGKHGKYKPFYLLSIIMTLIGAVALYALPSGVAKKPALVCVWVIVFYLFYDIGTSFYNPNLLYRTMTSDVKERAKLALGPALFTLVIGAASSGMMAIIVKINDSIGNFNTTFMIVVGVACLVSALVSVVGWFCVKERHVVQQEEGEKVKLSDLVELLKTNKAMVIHVLKCVFSGFIWTLLFATPTYYVKWGFCTDLATGQVDMAKLGTWGLIVAMMMLFPMFIGNILGRPMLKLFKGNPIRLGQFNLALQGVGGLVLFLAQITGLLAKAPIIFFGCLFLMALAIATDSIPQATVEMETMDYTIYKTGKDRSALTGVLSRFLQKAQGAVSSALVGVILIAIGYNVDSVTGDFVGDVANIPTMLNWFIVVMGLVPAVLAIISILIYQKYPLTNEERAEMRAALDSKEDREHAEA